VFLCGHGALGLQVLVSTILTLVVIPLGCVSARNAFCPKVEDEDLNLQAQCAVPTKEHPEAGQARPQTEPEEVKPSSVAPSDVTQAKAGTSDDTGATPSSNTEADAAADDQSNPSAEPEKAETAENDTEKPQSETKTPKKPRKGHKRGIRLKDLDDE
jgi:outer membrane biosynthesis protein TonB